MHREAVSIRNLQESDIDIIRGFVNLCSPLELHTPFTYWVLAKYFSDCCFIIEEDGEVVGFSSSVRSTKNPEIMYFWQLGIAEKKRGQRYTALLIDRTIGNAKKLKCKIVQVSIEPGNKSSYHSFLSYCQSNNLLMENTGALNIKDTLSNSEAYEYIYDIAID